MAHLLLALAVAALLVAGLVVRPPRAVAANERSSAPPCENGTVVAEPAAHPELVQDCEILLGLKDELAGSATLNWSASLPISHWDGITVDQPNPDAALRVTVLSLRNRGLDGMLRPVLRQLSGLQVLWRSLSQLSGSIEPELTAIVGQLERLNLIGRLPMLSGIGLTGRIPPQLGNLSGLKYLYLDGNRLTGSIPTRLGRLTNLQRLHLHRNQLSGVIPTQLGALTLLGDLRLADNQLVSAIPTQLIALPLRRLYLGGNTITGCLPDWVRPGYLQFGDTGRLGLADCAANPPATPTTPVPTYTLTATTQGGGSVSPAGATTHAEATAVTLTASWNDATTDTFAGWSGDCSGTATTCVLEMYADKIVTATFTPLPADRCATITDADCIRAVYKGAPDDYAQVQDIPVELLLAPDDDGRYRVRRGEQVTVVTAARLPSGQNRFYMRVLPDADPSPTSHRRLIPPVGTTYTFTPTLDGEGATLITFDLTAARPRPLPRPGQKPELGAIVVTTVFRVASCASGTAVADPTNNAELVADCERLIRLRDVLVGSGTLNWDVRTAITGWQGVTISGTPQRVTELNLASLGLNGELSGLLGELDALTELRLNSNALTGRIPSKLTTLTDLTHLYLAGNSFAGCLPPDLRDVANNDLSSLSLTDCGAPNDISYGEHTLTAGTYEFALVDDGPAVMFDVPAGLNLEIVGIVLSESEEGDSTLGLILRNTLEQSWICVDLEMAEECYRKIVSTTQPGTPDIAALFDRLAESIWMDTSP